MSGLFSKHFDPNCEIRRQQRVKSGNKQNHQLQQEAKSGKSALVTQQPSLDDNIGIVLDKPRFQQYSTLESRKTSFKTWPTKSGQLPERLAEAGFAYTGTGDAVRCYHCGGGLRDWNEEYCPWREHAWHYKHCGHVRQCLGDKYITQLHNANTRTEDAASNNLCFDKRQPFSIVDTYSDVTSAMERNKTAVEAVQEFVDDATRIRDAVRELTSSGKNQTFTAMNLMEVIERIEQEEKVRSCDKHPNSNKYDIDESDLTEDHERKTNTRLKETLQCKICLDANACIITLPCGHLVTCPQCISALSKCAICRTEIKGTVRAFMSLG